MANNAGRSDILTRQERSALMSRIRGKNTKPEMALRKALFALGLRYRLHTKDIPGRPDIVLPRYRTVIFVNGCFWHGHRCHLFRWPKGNSRFWKAKIEGNQRRDARVHRQLLAEGWRSITVWECSIRRMSADRIEAVACSVARRITAEEGVAQSKRTTRLELVPRQ